MEIHSPLLSLCRDKNFLSKYFYCKPFVLLLTFAKTTTYILHELENEK